MVVQRNTMVVKQGKMMEVIDLVKQAFEIAPPAGNYRLYTDFVGQSNTMAWEIEFENLAAFQKDYEAMFSNEDLAEIGARISDLVTGEGHNEIWHVHV